MAKGRHAVIRELRRGRTLVMLTVLAMLAALLVFPAVAAASHTPAPSSVTVAGSLQSELGCPGDWQPECAATHLTYDVDDTVWQDTFAVPAGSWEYKAALNDSWDENYGVNATQNGANIGLYLDADTDVKFYYDHETHWITDNVNSVIATVPGSFQSELGCAGDWQPDCLRSWLQDADADGTYTFSTSAIPPGSYEAKVTINESWDVNYGAGGVPNGPNLPFDVVLADSTVTFDWDSVSKVLTVSVTINLGSESFDALEATIEGMGLESAGIENSLLKKIQNAQKSFDKADGEVCEKLASFIAAVNAQDGKKLTPEQADLLRSQAEAVSDAYGCGA